MALRALLRDAQHVLVLDGGLGSELEALGADVDGPLWSGKVLLDAPHLIARVEESYLRAGSRCLITATYQVTPQTIVQQRPQMRLADAEAVVEAAVKLAQDVRARYVAAYAAEHHQQQPCECKQRVCDDAEEGATVQPPMPQVFIAGSVGPYGAVLGNGAEYRGDYELPLADMQDFHRARIAALVRAGVDVLAVETQPSAREVRAIIDLLTREFAQVPVWVSFTTAPHAPHTHLCDGTPLADIVPMLDGCAQVIAVGVNCIALHHTSGALEHLRTLTSKPLVAYSNSGETYDRAQRAWLPPPAGARQTLAEQADTWVRAGARLLGGCCRTGPRDIAQLCTRLQQLGYIV